MKLALRFQRARRGAISSPVTKGNQSLMLHINAEVAYAEVFRPGRGAGHMITYLMDYFSELYRLSPSVYFCAVSRMRSVGMSALGKRFPASSMFERPRIKQPVGNNLAALVGHNFSSQ